MATLFAPATGGPTGWRREAKVTSPTFLNNTKPKATGRPATPRRLASAQAWHAAVRAQSEKVRRALPGMKHEVQVFRQRKRIRLLWIASPILASLLFFTEPIWVIGDIRNDIVRQVGAIALFTCIAGRCWAALHIGGLKNQQLITSGPYAYTRNPLYFFSSVGLAGVGLAVGSVTLGAIFFCFGYLCFNYVIRREEEALEQFFQDEYRAYVKSVPRFLPMPLKSSFTLPSSENSIKKTETVEKTFQQALPFLAAIPLYNVVQYIQEIGIISPIIRLY